MANPHTQAARELDSRTQHGVEVRMLWVPGSDRVSIVLEDRRKHTGLVFSVPGNEARDAFQHPYVWCP